MTTVCITAVRSRPDGTSGGLCTRKYVELLGSRTDVKLLSPEEEDPGEFHFLPGRVEANRPKELFRFSRIMATRSTVRCLVDSLPRLAQQKIQAALRYGCGFTTGEHDVVRAWQRAIREFAPSDGGREVIFAFGAGMDFSPHIALAGMNGKLPWVAYYHDPWPGHLYPEPYRWRWSVPCWHLERWHRRILRKAPALAFPSARLRDWILQGDLEPLREKAFILPHLAMGPPSDTLRQGRSLPEGFSLADFNVTHAGTVLRQRSPWALLEGFRRFVGDDKERRERARLWLVGWVDRHIQPDERWKQLTDFPGIRVICQRVPYSASMEILFYSTAGVILEAVAEQSPFYPGKLADLLYLRKPILAVTPKRSTVRDMLGPDYPLLCAPARAEEVASGFERLWRAWKAGNVESLAPPEAAVAMASPAAALREIERIFVRLGVAGRLGCQL